MLERLYECVYQIQLQLKAMRASVKQGDIYDATQKQLGLSIPTIPKRTNSLFVHVWNDLQLLKAQSILNLITTKLSDWQPFQVQHEVRKRSTAVSKFLKLAVPLTEFQSSSAYSTFSMTCIAFRSLLPKCRMTMKSLVPVLQPIATEIFKKLKIY